MAIHPTENGQGQQQDGHGVDVEAWAEQAAQAIKSVTISENPVQARGTSVPLEIPLDDHAFQHGERNDPSSYKRYEPVRRDSLKRREALLKGKEGSRRRQRWENGA
jgi:hypothetical protein